MKQRTAFTLIELLVVIAIIAILAAILFPVFAQAKDAAKKAVAISNMKQIGLAGTLYYGDYDDVTPPLYWFDPANLALPSTFGFYYWPVLLLPYTKNEQIFLDPKDTQDDPVLDDPNGLTRFDPKNMFHYYIVGANPSYGYNYRYLNTKINEDPNGNGIPYYYAGLPSTTLAEPSSTVMFAEATMKDLQKPNGGVIENPIGYSRVEPPSRWTGTWPTATAYGQIWPRYTFPQAIVAWLDGHVKLRSVYSLKGDPATTQTLDAFYNGTGG